MPITPAELDRLAAIITQTGKPVDKERLRALSRLGNSPGHVLALYIQSLGEDTRTTDFLTPPSPARNYMPGVMQQAVDRGSQIAAAAQGGIPQPQGPTTSIGMPPESSEQLAALQRYMETQAGHPVNPQPNNEAAQQWLTSDRTTPNPVEQAPRMETFEPWQQQPTLPEPPQPNNDIIPESSGGSFIPQFSGVENFQEDPIPTAPPAFDWTQPMHEPEPSSPIPPGALAPFVDTQIPRTSGPAPQSGPNLQDVPPSGGESATQLPFTPMTDEEFRRKQEEYRIMYPGRGTI